MAASAKRPDFASGPGRSAPCKQAMEHLLAVSTNPLPAPTRELVVGVRALPYLADHGFQDMTVVPGAFYVETAMRVSCELFGRAPRLLRNVTFQHPIIVSADDTTVHVKVTTRDDGRARFAFYEGPDDPGDLAATRPYAATLDVDWTEPAHRDGSGEAFSIEAFRAQAATFDASELYDVLRANGNQYGPAFRRVLSIWRAGDQSLARLSVPREQIDDTAYVHPCLLDSMTHVMAPFLTGTGKTVVLRSIGTIEIRDLAFPATVWSHAALLRGSDESGAVGDIRVFDEAGVTFLELSAVTFGTLENAAASEEHEALNLVIASNFTAEPLADTLRFWSDHFGVQARIEFAPYNQVFQQLLDRGSAFHRNREGINVILLELSEWATAGRRATLSVDHDRAAACFAGRARCILPNGLEIVHLNQYETDYLYKEIFEDRCYLKHGIRLRDGDVIVDIGANIGLFSLFVLSRCANAQIYAFEPAPAVYELLKANLEMYGASAHAINLGVSDRPRTAAFTFYGKSSVFSSFHANEAEDRAAIETVVRNALTGNASLDRESVDAYVAELTADRLGRSVHDCRLTSVSEVIRQHRLARINLLKIDAEKSELAIIDGIDRDDWPKIDQIVIEVHDRTRETVQKIADLLIEKGFRCAVEQERLLEHSGLINLYAVRGEAGEPSSQPESGGLERHVQDFAAAQQSFMSESPSPLVLCVCPPPPAAAADPELRDALQNAEQSVLAAADAIPNVYPAGSTSILRGYPVHEYYDSDAHHLGHVPYTPAGYAAIGTALVRTVFNLNRPPYKAIVLDCDNTLWKGICGEDGPSGIEVTPAHRILQEFMIDQMNAGMLLCLCSRNNEKDVLDVFDLRRDMALEREHIAAMRVNWNSKAANIRSLAGELGLALDSFIFVDDNPVDCADVRINCPEVLTLQLPQDPATFPSFLDHTWAFDRRRPTHEDRNRTRMYRENTARERLRERSLTLKEFITELGLRVEIREATEADVARVSQLTFRTNQFNFTAIRRSEGEIRRFIELERATCLAVRVVDRFGDYGLVGVVMYEATADRFKVDTYLLSCRVLGRGVEHIVAAQLGQRARLEGKQWVEFAYAPTNRNAPALEFLAGLGARYRNEAGTCWTLPAAELARLSYEPDQEVPKAPDPGTSSGVRKTGRRGGAFGAFGGGELSDRLQHIGEHLSDVDHLLKAIDDHRARQQTPAPSIDVPAANALETALLAIWQRVLGRRQIGLNDNFFEAGGTSVKAVQVIASIKKELHHTLSIVTLFECPTVALLAARLAATPGESSGDTALASADHRGRQRRYRTVRRRDS